MNTESDKSKNTIDAGAASMAYMPGAGRNAEDAADREMSIDKKAEQHTMADIAAELGAEDEAKKAVKVSVGGDTPAKPTKPVKAAAKTKPEPASKPADEGMPLVITDNTTPLAGLEDESENEIADESPEKSANVPPSKRKGGLGKLVMLVVALGVLGAAAMFGWLWWKDRAVLTNLRNTITGLEESEASLQKQLDSVASSADSTVSPTPLPTGTRLIPEVALNYKLTDTTKKITYSYSETTDSSGAVHSIIRFNSTDLVAAERKVVSDPSKYTCMTDDAPLGTLTSYKAADTVPTGGKASALTVDGKTNFKLGETYFVFTSQQSTCSSDKTVQAAQTAGKALVTELLSTLAR